MPPDLGSQVIETAIALAFVFFLLSLIASGVTELFATLMRFRAKDLEEGIRELLPREPGARAELEEKGEARLARLADDPAEAVLEHPLVSNFKPKKRRFRGDRKTGSYISPRNFTIALFDTLVPPEDGRKSKDMIKAVRESLEKIPRNHPMRAQLEPILIEAGNDIAAARAAVETWFDDGMERVSGWYKRRSQLIIAVVAIGLAVVLNASTVRIADRLWEDDLLRQTVADAADLEVQQAAAETAATEEAETGGTTDEAVTIEEVEEQTQALKAQYDEVAGLQLPIGWGPGNDIEGEVFQTIAGWLLTAFAVSLGAPFWFDALSRLAPLRTTGPKPDTKSAGGDKNP